MASSSTALINSISSGWKTAPVLPGHGSFSHLVLPHSDFLTGLDPASVRYMTLRPIFTFGSATNERANGPMGHDRHIALKLHSLKAPVSYFCQKMLIIVSYMRGFVILAVVVMALSMVRGQPDAVVLPTGPMPQVLIP